MRKITLLFLSLFFGFCGVGKLLFRKRMEKEIGIMIIRSNKLLELEMVKFVEMIIGNIRRTEKIIVE